MKLGISGQALGDIMPFADIVKMGKKYGVYDYEIWPCNVGVENDYAKGDIAEMKRILKEEIVNLYCVTLGSAFSKEATTDPDIYAEYLIHAIDAAKELGASVVNHYCGSISSVDSPDFTILEKYWRKPLEHARKMGITLVLENEAHDSTSTPKKMLNIMKHFDDPYFKTNFDAVNYFHSSCEGFPGAYEILKPYISYIHIKNACLYEPGTNQPEYNKGMPMSGHYAPNPIQYTHIPDGAVNIPALVTRVIDDGNYKGIFTLEPHTTTDHVEEFYARETEWLRQLGFFK